MKDANTFWAVAIGVGIGSRFGIWGLIGTCVIIAIIVRLWNWWRKKRMEDEGY